MPQPDAQERDHNPTSLTPYPARVGDELPAVAATTSAADRSSSSTSSHGARPQSTVHDAQERIQYPTSAPYSGGVVAPLPAVAATTTDAAFMRAARLAKLSGVTQHGNLSSVVASTSAAGMNTASAPYSPPPPPYHPAAAAAAAAVPTLMSVPAAPAAPPSVPAPTPTPAPAHSSALVPALGSPPYPHPYPATTTALQYHQPSQSMHGTSPWGGMPPHLPAAMPPFPAGFTLPPGASVIVHHTYQIILPENPQRSPAGLPSSQALIEDLSPPDPSSSPEGRGTGGGDVADGTGAGGGGAPGGTENGDGANLHTLPGELPNNVAHPSSTHSSSQICGEADGSIQADPELSSPFVQRIAEILAVIDGLPGAAQALLTSRMQSTIDALRAAEKLFALRVPDTKLNTVNPGQGTMPHLDPDLVDSFTELGGLDNQAKRSVDYSGSAAPTDQSATNGLGLFGGQPATLLIGDFNNSAAQEF